MENEITFEQERERILKVVYQGKFIGTIIQDYLRNEEGQLINCANHILRWYISGEKFARSFQTREDAGLQLKLELV